MQHPERWLRFVLRWMGTVALLALPAVVLPYAWMNAIHQHFGMGALPREPIVGYLARTLSAFYAAFGALLWVVSFDLMRHAVVIRFVGFGMIGFALVALGVDWVEGMPAFWSRVEAPVVLGWGGMTLWLNRQAASQRSARE